MNFSVSFFKTVQDNNVNYLKVWKKHNDYNSAGDFAHAGHCASIKIQLDIGDFFH